MEEENSLKRIDESIKFGYFYTSQTNMYKCLKDNKNMHSIDVNDSDLDWNEQRKQINLSDFSIIFLDGGNPAKIIGINLLGDEVADYVENGGVVCTLGASNASNAYYTVKGRWKEENYQAARSKQEKKKNWFSFFHFFFLWNSCNSICK